MYTNCREGLQFVDIKYDRKLILFLEKTKMVSELTDLSNLTIRRIIEEIKDKNISFILFFIDFSIAFDSIDRNKMRDTLIAYVIPKYVVNAIIILYINTRVMVRSSDGHTNFFKIITGVLQGNTIATFLFINND